MEKETIQVTENQTAVGKIYAHAGLSLVVMLGATLGVQFLMVFLAKRFTPQATEQAWFVYLTTIIGFYCVGAPLFYVMMKKLPTQPQQMQEMKPFDLIRLFFSGYALVYVCNLITTIVALLISLAKGSDVINPLQLQLANGPIWLNFLVVVVAAPLVEEFVFRKLLYGALRPYGVRSAVLFSALAFGLYHMNLYQILFATVLGTIFALVVEKTGTIRYSVILHTMINGFTVVVLPLLMGTDLTDTVRLGLTGFFIMGIVGLGVI
ncbi:MAG: CPBP family intramembrane metalloprotease, partial [Oscillospiraceae bacterium]|nr:CPBP family intramembrane metalloprotease [Oscillospiraceae bacterium]